MKFWPFNSKNKTKKRKYEGASQGRRTSGWNTPSGDANSALKRDLPWLRERSRDLRRNDAHAAKAISVISNGVIGKGIATQIGNDPSETHKKLFKSWTESTSFDFEGRSDLKAMQKLLIEAVAESGEVLVRRRFSRGPIPIQYQVLESDFLDTDAVNAETKGNIILQGIEFDPSGRRVGYHIFEQHPASSIHTLRSLNSNFIPESQIIHLFRCDRPGQQRGVPWLSPVMIALKDLGDYMDGELLKQKIASLFVAFVRDLSSDVECEDESDLGEKLVPGLIEHLPPGKSIDFASPPQTENFEVFTKTNQRKIATGIGISYESLSSDFSEVNFSSGRMGWIQEHKNFDSWRKTIMINHFMKEIADDYKLLAELNGLDASLVTFDYIAPKRDLIDPEKEIRAAKDAVRAGFTSRSKVIESFGDDADAVHEQIKKDNEKADQDKLILDSDPRYTTTGGTMQGSAKAETEPSSVNNSGDNNEENNEA